MLSNVRVFPFIALTNSSYMNQTSKLLMLSTTGQIAQPALLYSPGRFEISMLLKLSKLKFYVYVKDILFINENIET